MLCGSTTGSWQCPWEAHLSSWSMTSWLVWREHLALMSLMNGQPCSQGPNDCGWHGQKAKR